MKYKQICSKSLRQHIRCSLCDCLLKTSSTYRYLLMGKSIHEKIIINNTQTITYAECCEKYFNEISQPNQLNMICPKCSENLQQIYTLHLNADVLTKKMRGTFKKTKRLNLIRSSKSDDITIIAIKEEPTRIPESIVLNNTHSQPTNILHHFQPNIASINSAFVPVQRTFSDNYRMNNPSVPYAQFMIESPMCSEPQPDDLNNQPLPLDDDRSLSPSTNDDETKSKTSRLSRRQYDFLIQLPDQQSLNTFIETSSTESNSRWTWRRTSANSRGYKIYYVCNFSMRRHYHPCPAAMYALFNPEGTISIYSHGQHQHIPKNHIPSTITDQTKEEIFKCLQIDMSASEIRERLIRLKLPFGDTKKLNNFIKYHKEILRFGAVTNVRLNGSAYRQPQYWAIRRPSPTNVNTTTL